MNQLEQKLEQDFGIVFSQKDLLETAFTHTSYANEHRLLNISHNERLEFLGDAVLQLLISQYLFKKYPMSFIVINISFGFRIVLYGILFAESSIML